MASSSSNFGFQHGFVFKIKSVVKGSYSIEIKDGSVEAGAEVVSSKSKNVASQKFKTEQVEDAPGEYRVGAMIQPSDGTKLVWDYISGEGLVIHNTVGGSPNQIWTTERVYPRNDRICLIKTKDNMCLKYTGKGKQVAVVPKNVQDLYQHWQLQPTTSY